VSVYVCVCKCECVCESVCVCVCVTECDNTQQNTLHLQCVGRSQAKKDRMKEVVK